MQPDRDRSPLDCIVIGGGPAGLSAALLLARYRRRVLTFHDNAPRNQYSHGVHAFLGHDGILPADLLTQGRAEVSRHGGQIIESCVTRAEQLEQNLFRITTATGGFDRTTFETRRLVLATGLRDLTPRCPGFREFYGRSVHHCPDCDGFEVIGKHVAVLGSGKSITPFLLKLLTWTNRLTLITDASGEELPGEHADRLRSLGIAIVSERISRLEGDFTTGQLQSVRFEGDRVLQCEALFFSLGTEPASDLHVQLGCELDEETGLVSVDPHQETSLPGVYAAGDLTPGSQLAVVAAAEGAKAAIQIHKSLLGPEQTLDKD